MWYNNVTRVLWTAPRLSFSQGTGEIATVIASCTLTNWRTFMSDRVVFEGTPEHRITKIRRDLWGGFVPRPTGMKQQLVLKKIYVEGNYVVLVDVKAGDA
jgi:hypothetical protein